VGDVEEYLRLHPDMDKAEATAMLELVASGAEPEVPSKEFIELRMRLTDNRQKSLATKSN